VYPKVRRLRDRIFVTDDDRAIGDHGDDVRKKERRGNRVLFVLVDVDTRVLLRRRVSRITVHISTSVVGPLFSARIAFDVRASQPGDKFRSPRVR